MTQQEQLFRLHQVAMHAKEALELCRALGIHLGPLKEALENAGYGPIPLFDSEVEGQ